MYVSAHSYSLSEPKGSYLSFTVPSKLRAWAIAHYQQDFCSQKICIAHEIWCGAKWRLLMLLSVVQGTVQGACVFAQTRTKLDGTLRLLHVHPRPFTPQSLPYLMIPHLFSSFQPSTPFPSFYPSAHVIFSTPSLIALFTPDKRSRSKNKSSVTWKKNSKYAIQSRCINKKG